MKIVLSISAIIVIICILLVLRSRVGVSISEDDRLLQNRVVRIRDVIDDQRANEVIARLLFLSRESPTKPIHLHIDSPGGSVSAGLAIVDTINTIKTPVHTHCDKLAGSMALVILTRGRQGNRSARESATLSFAMPKALDDARRADAERFGDILIGKVSEATGIPKERVRQMFLNAVSLNGKEAVQSGLVDKVE